MRPSSRKKNRKPPKGWDWSSLADLKFAPGMYGAQGAWLPGDIIFDNTGTAVGTVLYERDMAIMARVRLPEEGIMTFEAPDETEQYG